MSGKPSNPRPRGEQDGRWVKTPHCQCLWLFLLPHRPEQPAEEHVAAQGVSRQSRAQGLCQKIPFCQSRKPSCKSCLDCGCMVSVYHPQPCLEENNRGQLLWGEC